MSMACHKLSRATLRGVWPALMTPWTDDDRLDDRRFAREVRSYADTGVHGVYTGGTTGEFYAQDDATFERITRIACEEAHAVGLPVQIGCTGLSTRIARQRIRVAVQAGADAIQLALPFWLEMKDDEVLGYMQDVAKEAGVTPLVLYHTMRSKRRVSPSLLREVATVVPTFIGLKDTACDVLMLQAMLHAAPDLAILGSEHELIEKTRAGGRGTCSSVAGLNPWCIVELYEHCAAGRYDVAERIEGIVRRLMAEVLMPLVNDEGLTDSAVDRVQRLVGGGDVGLRCQRPYRSATPEHVARLEQWCRDHAPLLLERRGRT